MAELGACDDPSDIVYRAYSGSLWLRFHADAANLDQNVRGFHATVSTDD